MIDELKAAAESEVYTGYGRLGYCLLLALSIQYNMELTALFIATTYIKQQIRISLYIINVSLCFISQYPYTYNCETV